jgi:hypothetical protein
MIKPSLLEAKKRTNKEVLVKTNEYIVKENLRELGKNKKYFVKTYGCQMNEHDSENIKAILEDMSFIETDNMEDADLILLNTCAIRENAHNKVFGMIGRIKHMKETKPHLIAGITVGTIASGIGGIARRRRDGQCYHGVDWCWRETISHDPLLMAQWQYEHLQGIRAPARARNSAKPPQIATLLRRRHRLHSLPWRLPPRHLLHRRGASRGRTRASRTFVQGILCRRRLHTLRRPPHRHEASRGHKQVLGARRCAWRQNPGDKLHRQSAQGSFGPGCAKYEPDVWLRRELRIATEEPRFLRRNFIGVIRALGIFRVLRYKDNL